MPRPSPTAAGEFSPADKQSLPTPQLIGYCRRLLLRRYCVAYQDVDDVIAQALLDFLIATRRACQNKDGLFLLIAQRRGYDWRRHRRTEVPLSSAPVATCPPELDEVEGRMILRHLSSAAARRQRLDHHRLLGVTGGILSGASFAEACRAIGVPRGSQQRYRKALQDALTALQSGRSKR